MRIVYLNAFPGMDAHRKRLHVKPFAPTITKVAEVVPQKVVPSFEPVTPRRSVG